MGWAGLGYAELGRVDYGYHELGVRGGRRGWMETEGSLKRAKLGGSGRGGSV